MSQGEDFGSGVDYQTLRGRDYPTICQYTVFLENRVGVLLGLIRRFRGTPVKIMALNIIDSTECCIVRFILSHPEQYLWVHDRYRTQPEVSQQVAGESVPHAIENELGGVRVDPEAI